MNSDLIKTDHPYIFRIHDTKTKKYTEMFNNLEKDGKELQMLFFNLSVRHIIILYPNTDFNDEVKTIILGNILKYKYSFTIFTGYYYTRGVEIINDVKCCSCDNVAFVKSEFTNSEVYNVCSMDCANEMLKKVNSKV